MYYYDMQNRSQQNHKQPNRTNPINSSSNSTKNIRKTHRLSSPKTNIQPKTLAILFRQIAINLDSGISLISALTLLSEVSHQAGIQHLCNDMLNAVNRGSNASSALEKWIPIVPAAVTGLIAIGEKTGRLGDSFNSAAAMMEFFVGVRNRLIQSILYPLFVLIVALFILPLPQIFTSGISSYVTSLVKTFGSIGVVCFVVYFLVRISKSNLALSRFFSRLLLSVPVVGNINRKLAVARFAKILAISINAGLDMPESVKSAAGVCGNEFITGKIYANIDNLIAGRFSLTEFMTRADVFSPMTLNMISAGERSGNIDSMLMKVAEIVEDEALTSIQRVTILLGPLVFIILAIFIGYYVVHFWQSYFGRLDAIQHLIP